MSMKRTNVYADPEDLALIKEAAKRRGILEAEIIREGIHLAATANRVWGEPLDWPTFEGSGEPVANDEITSAVTKGVAGGRSSSRTPPGSSPLLTKTRPRVPIVKAFSARPGP
ncbi:CopG family transcriptional regulator [Microbispora sp. NPDC088329]|uniref:ribbon-helix-helix domain-containing protein n=1 Tax=Microbispora sp. NPDC088329 TaxID=3154869 RepID=UPI00341A027E